MIVGGQTEARAQLSSTIMSLLTRALVWELHTPGDGLLTNTNNFLVLFVYCYTNRNIFTEIFKVAIMGMTLNVTEKTDFYRGFA